jgi:hypothetical protein
VFGGAGIGSGLTQRFMCYSQGAESVALAEGHLAPHVHYVPQGINMIAYPGSGSYFDQSNAHVYWNAYRNVDSTGSGVPFAVTNPVTWIN